MKNAKRLSKKLLSALLCLCLVLPLFSAALVPLAAELKAALATEASAASTTDLNRMRYKTEGYHYFSYTDDTRFIDDISVKVAELNQEEGLVKEGYIYPTDVDLNKGTGFLGMHLIIKMGFRVTSEPIVNGEYVAFTKVAVSTDKGQGSIDQAQWSAYYRFNTNGTRYPVIWERTDKDDLNDGVGGATLYFCNTHDTRVGAPLTLVYPMEQEGDDPHFARYLDHSGAADLNQGASGAYLRLWMSDDPVRNFALPNANDTPQSPYSNAGTEDVSEALESLQTTYNRYNDYLDSTKYTTASYNALDAALNAAVEIFDEYDDFYAKISPAEITQATMAISSAAMSLATTVTFNVTENGGDDENVTEDLIVGINNSGAFDYNTSKKATKEGWSFVGWNTDPNATTGEMSFTVGFKDTVYAIFSKTVDVQFSYLTPVGSVASAREQLIYYNNETTKTATVPDLTGFENVSKKGNFTLLGFRADNVPGPADETIKNSISYDADTANPSYRYYAVYSRPDLTLSYDLNYEDAPAAPASQQTSQYISAANKREAKSFTITDVIPEREGYTFTGWAEKRGADATLHAGDTFSIDVDKILYACWIPTQYTVTYDTNGGKDLAPLTYDTENKKTKLATPKKDGYTFVSWIVDAVDEENPGTWVKGTEFEAGTRLLGNKGDVTLKAQWTPNDGIRYAVYHMLQTADGEGYEQYRANIKRGVADSVVDVRDMIITDIYGYEFAKSEANSVEFQDTTTLLPDGSLAIYLYYDRVSFKVDLTDVEHATELGGKSYRYGETAEVGATCDPGYAVTHWVDGEGNVVSDLAGFQFVVEKDITLTPVVEPQSYTITIEGGDVIEYYYGGNFSGIDATKVGYTFKEWRITVDDSRENNWLAVFEGGVITPDSQFDPTILFGNVILTPVYEANTYTITFETSGGTTVNAITYTIETPVILPTTEKEGSLFAGWYADETAGNWGTTYAGNQVVSGMYGDITLKADYRELAYTLTFDVDGGNSVDAIIYSNTGAVFRPIGADAVLPTPVRPGYAFAGWTCTAVSENPANPGYTWAVGTDYAAGLALTGQVGNAAFKAKWTKVDLDLVVTVPETVEYDGPGTINTGEPFEATFTAKEGYELGSKVTILVDDKPLYRANYEYACNADRSVATLKVFGPAVVGDLAITVTASPIVYTITYDQVYANHGFATTYTIESEDITIGAPVRSGYEFAGWQGTGLTGDAADNMSITISTGSIGDRAYTANWNKEYRVVFVNTGDTEIQPITFKLGDKIEIPTPTKEGSKFVTWNAEGWSVDTLAPGTHDAIANDLRLTAVFDDSTTYTVETYYMNTDGEYEKTENDDIHGQVFVGDAVSVTPDAEVGFTLDAKKSVLSGTVAKDGALTLKVYYARNQYIVSVETDANIASVEGDGTYYYEEEVTLLATAKPGYSVVGWTGDAEEEGDTIVVKVDTKNIALKVTSEANEYTIVYMNDDEVVSTVTYTPDQAVTFANLTADAGYDPYWVIEEVEESNWTAGKYAPGAEFTGMYGNITVIAQPVAKDDTVYTVNIYKQNLENDEYALVDTIEKKGTTDTVVAAPEAIEGFKLPAASELKIAGNGLTVVDYKYDRNTYTVTYDVLGEKDVDTYKFGATIEHPEDPAETGYQFRWWNDYETELATVMGAKNLTYTAVMEATPYEVKYLGVLDGKIDPVKYYIKDQIQIPVISREGYTVVWKLAETTDGWDAGIYTPGTLISAGKHGDVTLRADYMPNEVGYTIEQYFENVDGTFGEATTITSTGKTGSVVAAPVDVENYVTPTASKQTIAGDGSTVVEYRYYLAENTVSYEVFDEVVKTDTYKVGQTIVAPEDPKVTGYTFIGWEPAIIDVMPNEALTYKAKFETIPYVITFDANGGSAVGALSYDIEDVVTLPESTLANNYFVGWEVVSAEGNWTDADVVKGKVSAKYGNVELKAVWSATQSTYTVETYFMDAEGNYGEAASAETITGYVGDTAEYTAVETEGYSLDTENSVVEAVIANDGSTVLKAYYARNKYTVKVTIDGNGAQVVSGAGEYYFGATVDAEISIADHYELASWTGVEADGTTVTFTMPMEDVEIVAVVTPVVYTFTVDMKDGTDVQVLEYTIEDTVTIPAEATRDAYEFNGWKLVKEVGNWTQDDIVADNELSAKYGNVAIEATWTALTYTFAYDVNGGTMPSSYYFNEETYTVETPIVLPEPTKEGYRFSGWTVALEGDGNWKQAYSGSMNLGKGLYGNVVLKAAWAPVEVKVYIEHYLQDTWSDEYLLIDKATLLRPVGDAIDIWAENAKDVSEIVKHAEGQYTLEKAYVNGSAEPEYSAVVAADGSTTIQLYYLLDEHTVTITYDTPDGVKTISEKFRFGQTYNISSPKIVGYKPSTVTVSGKMGTENVTANITYSLASYKLTVNYIYANGKAAAESVTKTVPYGSAYSIASPELKDKYGEPVLGYTPSQAVVEGVMGNENIVVDVIYGLNTHTLTIHYVYTDGTVAADDYVAEVEYGYAYNVKSAVVDGYTASSPYVSGTITGDTELTVTYSVNTYTVIFRDYDGTEISVQHIVYGGAATAPADPVRPDDEKYSYEFKGWSADFSVVNGDMEIVAEYISTNLSTGETDGDDEPVDNSFFGKLKAFFKRLIDFFKVLFFIT